MLSNTPRRTLAVGAVGTMVFLLAMGLSSSSAEPDPPPPFYVSMDTNTAVVNATLDQNYTPATITGSILTNYPAYKYDIYIEAACGSSPTTSSPDHIEVRGKSTVNFTIGIALVKGDGPNTTCTGQLSITAIMDNPRQDDLYIFQGAIMAQAQWPLPNRTAAPSPGQDPLSILGQPRTSQAAEDLETAALIVVGATTVAILLIIRRKLNRASRRKRRA